MSVGRPNALFLVVLLAGLVGCGGVPEESPPKTWTASGKVINKTRVKLEGGGVEFQPLFTGGYNSHGQIGPDGSFTLQTLMRNGTRLPGAMAGTYRVTVTSLMGADQSVVIINLDQPYTVEARDGNTFTITITKTQ